jgi:hypothetical protein
MIPKSGNRFSDRIMRQSNGMIRTRSVPDLRDT